MAAESKTVQAHLAISAASQVAQAWMMTVVAAALTVAVAAVSAHSNALQFAEPSAKRSDALSIDETDAGRDIQEPQHFLDVQ
jgi:hypothetical protein